ncbi:dihydrodipicolinate synthase family protein [Actinomadura madurae]|uniref:dihydrodipicolinate synthase family protein n=1 Tax=Actinomadura madurae TaxID=1993 RepID=UPI003999C353
MELHGLMSALATPFTAGGASLDEAALRSHVDSQIQGGVHALIPCGSTGEFTTLTVDERRLVTEIVIDQAAGRVPVVPHVGALTARDAIALGRHAEEKGADALMVVAPFYEALPMEDVLGFYRKVAGAVSVPIMVYNAPLATGVNIDPDTMASLAREVEQIKYVKDTSCDMHQAGILIHEYGDAFKTFVGLDTLYFTSLAVGGAGAINGAANLIAPELVAVWDAIQANSLADARKAWNLAYPVMRFLTTVPYNAGVKAGLDILGKSFGDPREPLGALPAEARSPLEAALKRIASA